MPPGSNNVIIPRVFHLGFLATIFTGIAALAVGFFVTGYLWLSLDLSRPAPPGVDDRQRSYQLFGLWLGLPMLVIGVLSVFAIIAVGIGATVYSNGIR
jgi:hypothetical protein